MPGKLLLPSAKTGVLLEPPKPHVSPWWRRIALVVGILAVLVGTADLFTRAATLVSTTDISFSAFAPAALVMDPSLIESVQGHPTSLEPSRLLIPSIGVDAAVEQVGTKANGAMDTPKAIKNVAWYKLGQKPGQAGNAVFAGHLNSSLGAAGVFKDLSKVKHGDEVIVRGRSGEELAYVVEALEEYEHNDAPLDQLFSSSGPSGLILVTCEGTWDAAAHTYDKRLVVVARLLNP